MISTLDLWLGAVDGLYRQEMLQSADARAAAHNMDKIYIDHNPKVRGKNKIAESISPLLPSGGSGLFEEKSYVLVVTGPTGESYKEWVGVVVDLLQKNDTTFHVYMSVAHMTASDYPAPLKKLNPGVIEAYNYALPDDTSAAADVIVETLKKQHGITSTNQQMGYLLNRTDGDSQKVSESLSVLIPQGLSVPDKKLTNDMVRAVADSHIGLSTVFDFDDVAASGDIQKITDFIHRILSQKDSISLCLQLLTIAINKNRALLLLNGGFSKKDVEERTSFTKPDGTQWSMSAKQIHFLSTQAKHYTEQQLALLMNCAQRAVLALKGGAGYEMGKEAIMMTYAHSVAGAYGR